MPRNICTDRKGFFKAAFKDIIKYNGCIGDYGKFKDIPDSEYESLMDENLFEIVASIEKKNIVVSTENVGMGGQFTDCGLDGLHALPTGELFYAFDCGGDWETPVNAILYVENGRIKFYAPEKGNNFCIKHMCAWGSEPEADQDDEHDSAIDTDAELKDIEDYFHNRTAGKHAIGNKVEKPSAPKTAPRNEFYFVTTSTWCMRGNSEGVHTVSANCGNSYPNVFKTYDDALEYAHLMMMVNHGCQIHDWDKFKETIDIVEGMGDSKHSEGYIHHPMRDGIERFEGFDLNGRYPCVFDDIVITKRTVPAIKWESAPGIESANQVQVELEPVPVQHFIKEEKPTEFTAEQSESHQETLDRIADEIGGIDRMFDDKVSKKKEFDRMKEMLGWSDDEDSE